MHDEIAFMHIQSDSYFYNKYSTSLLQVRPDTQHKDSINTNNKIIEGYNSSLPAAYDFLEAFPDCISASTVFDQG